MAVLRRPSGRPRDDRLSRLRRELAASREEVRRLQRQVADRDEAIRRSEPDPPPVCGYRNSHYGTCPFHGGRCPGASA